MIMLIYIVVNQKETFIQIVKRFTKSIWEILTLQMIRIQCPIEDLVNAQNCYVSALLIVGYVIYYLLINNKKFLIELIAPFLIMLMHGYYSVSVVNLDVLGSTIISIKSGLLREFEGMSLGCICYTIGERMKRYSLKNCI